MMTPVEAIGRYVLQRRLGAGAFATVWLAHDPDLEVPVAVKVLADNWSADLDVRERFLAEARMLRRISDDRVIRVHDIGRLQDGRPYFVMDYADGGTVADVLKQRPDPVTALTIGAEAARGLQVLHDHGVVHRDVKPGNLLLTSRGDGSLAPRVLVADLGMAKALAESSGLTVTAGTPAYMAPEQAQGMGGFDQRADVYAVAAVTYALLTGRPPFAHESGLASIVTRSPTLAAPPLPIELNLPRDVDRVLAAALAHDRARRPASASQLANQLEALRDRLVAAGAGPQPDEKWGTGALVALALVTFLVFAAATWGTMQLLG